MSYYKRNKQPDVIETIIMAIGRGLWFLISWPFRGWLIANRKSRFNKEENIRKWLEIESMLNSGDEIHAKQAVIEADKFFENILRLVGAQGATFADKLQSYESHFNHETYQSIWDAHKVRNQISHDPNHKPSISDCKIAVERFKKGLNSLGAL